MPPRVLVNAPTRGWSCPQCRQFSSSRSVLAVGPEHPTYITIPQPPQQTLTPKPFVKGYLPVPRDVFVGSRGVDKSSQEWLEKHTQPPSVRHPHPLGSREEYRAKMAEMRRRNLREGLGAIKSRKESENRRLTERGVRRQQERHERLMAPEREDERLTTPSHGLDLKTLLHGRLQDPDRESRLRLMRENTAFTAEQKREQRLDALNTLYLNARSFITTPSALDTAVAKAFGTNERPVTFGDRNHPSVWALGKPPTIQDMLVSADRDGRAKKTDLEGGDSNVTARRMKVLAEGLTGGKMGEADAAR